MHFKPKLLFWLIGYFNDDIFDYASSVETKFENQFPLVKPTSWVVCHYQINEITMFHSGGQPSF